MFEDNFLPVENVGDGDGSFVAGAVNKYLNLKQAVTCPISFMYLVAEFNKLSLDDKFSWLDEQDAGYLGLAVMLGTAAVSSITAVLTAVELGLQPEDVDDFVTNVGGFLEAGTMVGDYTTDELANLTLAAFKEVLTAKVDSE